MLEIQSIYSFSGYHGYPAPVVSRDSQLLNQAISLFNKARRKSFFVSIKSALMHQTAGLLDLSILPKKSVVNQHYDGIRTINLNLIVGTMGRVGDFDNRFFPLSSNTRDRWLSVAIARCQYLPLEPVRLVRVGQKYFVEDGHHRISVARSLGESAIEAEITTWKVSGALPWETPLASKAHPAFSVLAR